MAHSKPLLLTLLFLWISSFGFAQEKTPSFSYDIPAHYTKKEVDIPMRDGIKLHTTIYSPKDQSREYPIIMTRTPYGSRPYGKDQFPERPYGMAANKYLL